MSHLDEVGRLEQAAQRASEHRLALCNELLYDEDEDRDTDPEKYAELAGPYCGCDTCIVREVLDAAWPHLLAVARLENAERPPQTRGPSNPGGE